MNCIYYPTEKRTNGIYEPVYIQCVCILMRLYSHFVFCMQSEFHFARNWFNKSILIRQFSCENPMTGGKNSLNELLIPIVWPYTYRTYEHYNFSIVFHSCQLIGRSLCGELVSRIAHSVFVINRILGYKLYHIHKFWMHRQAFWLDKKKQKRNSNIQRFRQILSFSIDYTVACWMDPALHVHLLYINYYFQIVLPIGHCFMSFILSNFWF